MVSNAFLSKCAFFSLDAGKGGISDQFSPITLWLQIFSHVLLKAYLEVSSYFFHKLDIYTDLAVLEYFLVIRWSELLLQFCRSVHTFYLIIYLLFIFPIFFCKKSLWSPSSKLSFSRVDVLQADLMHCMCISDGNGHTRGRKHFISVPVLSEYINGFVVHINFAPGVIIFCFLKIKLS